MPRIIDKERAKILQSTDEFIIDSAINGTRKVSFDTLKESLGTSGGSGEGGSANIEVDGALSSSSTNPVQNKVINTAINQTLAAAKSYTDNKVGNKMDQVTLATVATTGNYNDLKNKPTLPNLSNLAKVATSGSYNDLTDCPAIPEVPTLVSELTNDVGYITEDDLPVLPEVPTKVSELTNDSGFITSADLPEPVVVPTKTSDLTNDSGFITAEALPEFQNVPTKVSELTNDAGYITSADVPTKISQLTNDSSFITEEGVQSKIDTALTSVYKWKGSVANKDALPTSDNKIGDVYDTQDTGMNYGWNGTSWDSLGALVSGGYTKPEGGVPKADLAEDVQQSLAKADTALQSETQPDWNATSGAAAILNKPTKLSDFSNEDTQFITLNDLPENLGTTYAPGDGINIKNNTISTTSRIVDITQADYDKLTDEQKNANDIWYSIIDAKSSVVDYTQPFRFGIDADGNYGYYKVGADTVTPFKNGEAFQIGQENIIAIDNHKYDGAEYSYWAPSIYNYTANGGTSMPGVGKTYEIYSPQGLYYADRILDVSYFILITCKTTRIKSLCFMLSDIADFNNMEVSASITKTFPLTNWNINITIQKESTTSVGVKIILENVSDSGAEWQGFCMIAQKMEIKN